MTEIEDIDVFVSGGGVAGLTAAIAFAQAGFRTVCADPAPPITERDTEGADLRTTAFLQPAQAFLDRIGLWDRLCAPRHAASGHAHRGRGRRGPEPRVAHDFNAADISDKPFGWNLPNWLLRREMVAHLPGCPMDFRPGVGTANVLTRETEARVTLSDGARLRARLVIAADGRNSPCARRGHRRAHHALRAEGAGLRRHAPDPA
jgi:2-octaprenyl-6-methoxyphenol hydroxylase